MKPTSGKFVQLETGLILDCDELLNHLTARVYFRVNNKLILTGDAVINEVGKCRYPRGDNDMSIWVYRERSGPLLGSVAMYLPLFVTGFEEEQYPVTVTVEAGDAVYNAAGAQMFLCKW